MCVFLVLFLSFLFIPSPPPILVCLFACLCSKERKKGQRVEWVGGREGKKTNCGVEGKWKRRIKRVKEMQEGEAEEWHELKESLAEPFSECLSPHGVTSKGRGTEEASTILNDL